MRRPYVDDIANGSSIGFVSNLDLADLQKRGQDTLRFTRTIQTNDTRAKPLLNTPTNPIIGHYMANGLNNKHISSNMIRNRDIVALILAIILVRMAWNDDIESLSASANLAFYVRREKTSVFSPMDLDGDGTNEALAIFKKTAKDSNKWVLGILDLKRLHQFSRTTSMAPFQPNILFESEEVQIDASPLKMTFGHILVKAITKPKKDRSEKYDDGNYEINDRTRHYFCGLDWHDASVKCGTPCPGGQSSECGENEQCYADTPCDYFERGNTKLNDGQGQGRFQLTPGGGLPSLFTLFSNGSMTMHSLIKEKEKEGGLELRQMWETKLLPENIPSEGIEWEESNILFLDAYSSQEASSAENGMIVISTTYYLGSDDTRKVGGNSFVVALDAMEGTILWKSFVNEDLFSAADDPANLKRGSTSFARRRSRILSLDSNKNVAPLPDCMKAFKHHLREITPFAYWGSNDSTLIATHLDRKKRNVKQDNHKAHKEFHGHHEHHQTAGHSIHKNKKPYHHKHKASSLIFGRPNVLVQQTQGGLHIRSLKNGARLCHMSLLRKTVYSDLNNDGVMDQVQVLLDTRSLHPSNVKFHAEVMKRIQGTQDSKSARTVSPKLEPNLCHAIVLSGIPAREELFSANLCGQQERVGSLDYIAPIVVESLDGRRNSRDVVIALNNGRISRLDGGSGRQEWRMAARTNDDFPTWERGSQNALLARIPSVNVAPAIRPVLLAGENSLAIMSVKNGAILASITFPQTSVARPVLTQVSGDGTTTDVLITSEDGIWCFQVSVYPGSRILNRIMVGLLLMGLMLALLKNRFGEKNGKRSTDE